MATTTPYRSLPAPKRVELVTAAIAASRELRALYVQRLASRPGGFRAATLQSWAADRLARDVVRFNVQTSQDEFDLLHFLYVEREPAIQITFLDAAGVAHDEGRMADDAEPPYADADGVQRGVDAVRAAYGEDGDRYLRTLARYSPTGWPGIADLVTAD